MIWGWGWEWGGGWMNGWMDGRKRCDWMKGKGCRRLVGLYGRWKMGMMDGWRNVENARTEGRVERRKPWDSLGLVKEIWERRMTGVWMGEKEAGGVCSCYQLQTKRKNHCVFLTSARPQTPSSTKMNMNCKLPVSMALGTRRIALLCETLFASRLRDFCSWEEGDGLFERYQSVRSRIPELYEWSSFQVRIKCRLFSCFGS